MALSRETCKICFHANPIGFRVSDDVWRDVVPNEYLEKVVCISCFTRLADEKFIAWDNDIQLYPVSLCSHIREL